VWSGHVKQLREGSSRYVALPAGMSITEAGKYGEAMMQAVSHQPDTAWMVANARNGAGGMAVFAELCS
jgi:hypothetical protein